MFTFRVGSSPNILPDTNALAYFIAAVTKKKKIFTCSIKSFDGFSSESDVSSAGSLPLFLTASWTASTRFEGPPPVVVSILVLV
jgi:hypothetical protein